jgi:hypothetical protein
MIKETIEVHCNRTQRKLNRRKLIEMIRRAVTTSINRSRRNIGITTSTIRFASQETHDFKKKVVGQFLQDKEKEGENYLGIYLVESDYYEKKNKVKKAKHFKSLFSLSDVPSKYEE